MLAVAIILAMLGASSGLAQTTQKIVEPIPESLPGAPPLPEDVRAALARDLGARGKGYVPRTRHLREDGSPRYSNRLLLEKSPYLQQHAHNPVNWYPWGKQAFAEAKRLNRPVLVSIGYSTCHWCHVMEEETFESVEAARYLNAHFIAIKVDREARPDIDEIYMTALRTMNQRGGWPLNVWLTPDAKPFYGGTYFPPEDRSGRPAFVSVLRQIQLVYSEQPHRVQRSADSLTNALRAELEGQAAATSQTLEPAVLTGAVAAYAQRVDRSWGGIGSVTKFPSSLPIPLLLREQRRTGNADALAMATLALEKMAAGGIRDQLGGGFHRYSTEPRWLVPHFEIMLYDNAQLAVAYLQTAQLTGRDDFRQVARGILDYVLREMTDPEGGFYSATDADSRRPDGEMEEGWFFTWTPAEIERVLGAELAHVVNAWYGVTPGGNFEGRSILHTPHSREAAAQQLGISVAELDRVLMEARPRLLAARARRPAPARDDKVLAAWNGLMISAFAQAGFILDEPRYMNAASRAADYVLTRMRSDGRLHRVALGGEATGPAFLDDYAFMIAGLIDLYEADANPRWLRSALALQGVLDDHYLDVAGGGYFRTADDAERLLARERPARDGAVPSGNSVAAANLLRLSALTSNDDLVARLGHLYSSAYEDVTRSPMSRPLLLTALSDQLAGMREVVLVAPSDGSGLQPMLKPLRSIYFPSRILVVTREGKALEQLEATVPLVGAKRALGGKTTAYVCENRICQYPTSDPRTLAKQLSGKR
jgi:uncharacterized protein YyaL (SSP411 family)